MYFGEIGDPDVQWMLNFRVPEMIAQMRSAGISVAADPQQYPNGRFTRLHDPEGHSIGLWESQGRDAS